MDYWQILTDLPTWGEPMKRKSRAGLAVFLVGVMGSAALGDHHLGPQENCSSYPPWCSGQCAELNACRSGNTPIGGSDCGTEEANLRFCENSSPFPPVIIVTPVACPDGMVPNEAGTACVPVATTAAECARLREAIEANRTACKKKATKNALSCVLGAENLVELAACGAIKAQDDRDCDANYEKLEAALPAGC